ncbi:MAG: hypothetical protein VKS61_05050 [Candidatus Sericytochromatia bacterium]|nr:hypothetical protein [Candidatus Sericytochromatia bacterium]MEB3221426.1 hypothetical protein [Candidatus Sericytochromatia bacterium]
MLAIVNLTLVLFDYTYLTFRHVYQAQGWSALVAKYDAVRGIEPHRETEAYGREARAAFALLSKSPQSIAARDAIDKMRRRSTDLVDRDPFLTAGLRGVSERLKSRFRRHAWEEAPRFRKAVRTWKAPYTWAWCQERWRRDRDASGRPVPLEVRLWGFLKPTNPWDALSATESMIGSVAYAARRQQAVPSADRRLDGFWSAENLSPERLEGEAAWFEAEVVPLLDRNHWQTYRENGEPANFFWLIDCMFLPVFVAEFLTRGLVGVRRGVYPNFTLFVAARWYDVIYVLPLFMYALPSTLQGPLHVVRIISVSARMERLGLINPVAIMRPYLARPLDAVADLVNVKLLSSYQDGVRDFSLEKALDTLTPRQRKELEGLIEANLAMVVERVLPDVRPTLEALVTRTAQQALEQAPAYAQLKELPLLGDWPELLIRRAVAETVAQMQATMLRAVNDPSNVALTRDLVTVTARSLLRHTATLGTEAQLKAMVVEVLEEQKRKTLLG